MIEIISIIIPVRNEEIYIERCISSVLAFSLPENIETEIIIIDGMSTDQTVNILNEKFKQISNLRILKNRKLFQSVALNIGIRNANGEYILRLDAHSIYPRNYLSLCFETAKRTGADNVGGLIITKPGANTYQGHLIQALTTHPFGVGNSGFRTNMGEGKADTVPYGFYKRNLFDQIGFMDERLIRAQDYEFNRRLINSGRTIWRNPDILIKYFNQSKLLKFLKKNLLLEAPYNSYMWYLAPYSFAVRHAITGLFSFGVIAGGLLSFFFLHIRIIFMGVLGVYTFLALVSSIQQSFKYKNPFHVLILPLGFFSYHFIHGIGVLTGIFKLFARTAPVQTVMEPWEGYGEFRVKVY